MPLFNLDCKMNDDKYTINNFNYTIAIGTGTLQCGDWIDMITGDRIVGPYCHWPKQEPRLFKIVEITKKRNKIALKPT